MPYYKDSSNKVYFLDSAEFEYLLPDDCVPISDEEAAQLQAPPPPSQREEIIAQIVALEIKATPRRMREAVLGQDNGWLQDLDNQIATLRATLPPA